MKLYVVTCDGNAITKPLTMKQILDKFVSVRELEAAGLLVVEYKNKSK